jgi:hypothetical protein
VFQGSVFALSFLVFFVVVLYSSEKNDDAVFFFFEERTVLRRALTAGGKKERKTSKKEKIQKEKKTKRRGDEVGNEKVRRRFLPPIFGPSAPSLAASRRPSNPLFFPLFSFLASLLISRPTAT